VSNFTHRTVQEARLTNACDFCSEPIRQGARYVKYRGWFDKAWRTDRRHFECTSEFLRAAKCDECKGGLNLPEEDGYVHCTC